MVLGGVRQHEIDQDLEAEVVRPLDEAVEVIEGAEYRVDVAMFADIVPEIEHRRGKERRDPYNGDAERRDVRQAVYDTREIAYPVVVPVLKGSRIYLEDDGPAPPVRIDRGRRG